MQRAVQPDCGIVRPCANELGECDPGGAPLPPLHESTGAGRWVGTDEGGVEPLLRSCVRWAAQLLQSGTTLPPRCVVEHMERAVLGVERQAGEDLDPGADSIELIGKFPGDLK